jgi:membrane-bound lytic murein transglycosylase B
MMPEISSKHRGWVVAAGLGMALLCAPWPGGALCGEESAAADPPAIDSLGTSLDIEGFRHWLDELRLEARRQGISDTTLDSALRDIEPVPRVIELDRRQPEDGRTFLTYLSRCVDENRSRRGRAQLAKHRALLNDIYSKYGVPPRYLVALWGLETTFGENTGGFRTIDALATLAYDPRRARFFRTQLLDALHIIDAGHVTPDRMIGSWAGATGQMQFMPSTFIRHAVDYTGNGRKDIWGSLPDAFASAANFLSTMGWRPGETWGREVLLPAGFDTSLASMDRRKSLAQWSALGVRQINGAALPRADMKGSIVLPQGPEGPAFIVYHNFRVILRWNRSVNYAIAVGYLADRIAGLPEITTCRAEK